MEQGAFLILRAVQIYQQEIILTVTAIGVIGLIGCFLFAKYIGKK